GLTVDFRRADVAASGLQICLSINAAGIDVAARSECRQITGNVRHLNVPALCFQFADESRSGISSLATTEIRADISPNDIAAFGYQRGCPADIKGLNVSRSGGHIKAVGCGNSNFKMHPELRSVSFRELRKIARDFGASRQVSCTKCVSIQQSRRGRAARVGLDMHRV